MPVTSLVLRRVSRLLGFPERTGELVSRSARRRLGLSLSGSVGLSVLDMLGVLAMLPMMQYVSGLGTDSGALGWTKRALGEPSDRLLVAVLAGLIVACFVVKDVFAYLFRRWQVHFMAEQEVTMSAQVLEGYLVGPYSWHLVRNTGDKLFTIEGAVAIGYSHGLSSALGAATEAFTIGFIAASLLAVSPAATLVGFAYFGLAGLAIVRFTRPRVIAAGRRTLAATREMSQASVQSLGAAKEIKLRRAHAPFVNSYRASRTEAARAQAAATLLAEMPKYLLEIVFVLGVGLLAVVATATRDAQQLLILLGVFVAAGSRILPATVRLLNSLSQIRFSRDSLQHLVDETTALRIARAADEDDVVTTRTPAGDIAIEGVRFAYPDQPDADVLDGVDATIRTGASVAVVGSSGAGKSTLVDLLLGLHKPTGGTIRAGGLDIHANLPAWQRQLAVVPQDVYLLDNTLRNNIVFDEEADADRLAEVLARSQLADLVAALPRGLDTPVGERGARLSGGQRQRIGIARALYRRPSVLVLDEATSALDNETERRLTATIESLTGQMTMIIVAHRLSTVRHCDSLLFLSQGRVAASGTFTEVAARNPEFANLVALGSLAS